MESRGTMPDSRGVDGRWLKAISVNGVSCGTLSGRLWSSMMHRCIPNGLHQKRRPTYVGCVASEEFRDFQFFCDWHRAQRGYGLGYRLDKDLLVEGNKIYGAEQCVLIPSQLNVFFTARPGLRKNGLPRGVYPSRGSARYKAEIEFLRKTRFLGCYATPGEAAAAYKAAKEEDARTWADMLSTPEYSVEQRVIDRLRAWTLPKE